MGALLFFLVGIFKDWCCLKSISQCVRPYSAVKLRRLVLRGTILNSVISQKMFIKNIQIRS